MLVDFAGGPLVDDAQSVTAAASAAGGQIRETRVEKLTEAPTPGTWRLSLEVAAEGEQTVELRAALERGDAVVSETWTYALAPTRAPAQ